MSQYTTEPNTHNHSRNESLQVLPPTHSSNTIETNSDPPEDHSGISYQTPSVTQSPAPASTPNTQIPPRSINVSYASPTPLFHPMNQSATSISTTTSNPAYVSRDEFNKLKTTVERLEHNMSYFNTTLTNIASNTENLQTTLIDAQSNIQQQITNAVVNAMTTVQTLNKSSTSIPITNHTTINETTNANTTNTTPTYTPSSSLIPGRIHTSGSALQLVNPISCMAFLTWRQ